MDKVHLIGNAHLDPVWLWRWQEGYSEVLATFRSALDRIKESDDFIFTCAGAVYYKWVEETDYDMFEEIRERVRQGRWVIVGGWWIQPDCNIPCGESYVRQALYGQRYFREKFGIMATTGYNVDSFGHNAMLPQILKQSGINAYVFMRPNEKEKEYPFEKNTFLWQSPDGSSLPAYRIPEPYCSNPFGGAAERAEEHKQLAERQAEPIMSFYGVGNHGGGPTIENIESLHSLMKRENGKYLFSSPDAFFKEISDEQLPIYAGELQHHASGCYTAVMQLKSQNRICEERLIQAEKFGVMAKLLKVKSKNEDLSDAWKTTLFNQFHDIMGGCCIRSAVNDALEFFGESLTAAAKAANRALQSIAWNIDTSHGKPIVRSKVDFRVWEKDDRGTPLIIFNPHSFTVNTPVRLGVCCKTVLDDSGKVIPVQDVRAERTRSDIDDKYESEIIAQVEPLGWRLYWLYAEKDTQVSPIGALSCSENYLENDWIRIELKCGSITRLYDKVNKKELLAQPATANILDETDCDTWAHGVFTFDNIIGQFQPEKTEVISQGNVSVTVRTILSYGKSMLIRELCLYRTLPQVYLRYKVNWQEKHKMLKLSFPSPLENAVDTSAIPYGHIVRTANGKEQPMQKWVTMAQNGYGLGIATDTRSAYSAKNGRIEITALRSPVFADHYGVRDDLCEYTEQGEQSFTIMLMPVQEDTVSLQQISEVLNLSLPSILGTYHTGKLSAKGSLLRISAKNIIADVLKEAEDGNGLILRCHEILGQPTETEIELPELALSFKTTFSPQQIKTFCIKNSEVKETNLIETM